MSFYRDEQFDKLSERWANVIIARERGAAKPKDVAAAFNSMTDYLDAKFQAATESAKATSVAVGELFGYGSSEKKNCLLSKAQFDSCAPKNRTSYDIPLYAHSLPKCEGCKGYGVITHASGQTPDNYEECNEVCPECEGTGEAARQPAPVAIKTWQERMPPPFQRKCCTMNCSLPAGDSRTKQDLMADCPDCDWATVLGDDRLARDAEIADLRAALAATAAPVLDAEALHMAKELATAIWKDHWRETSPYWQPLETLTGLISQIDNMTCTLVQRRAKPEANADAEDAALEQAREALHVMLAQFTKTPSTLHDTEARCAAHEAISAIDAARQAKEKE